jgi:hypothetical protein
LTDDDTTPATIRVKGQAVKVRDDLWVLGNVHRITRIEPYTHPVVTRGEEWRIARYAGPGGTAWGITLHYDHGYAASYEVSYMPGDERKEVRPPADDYLSPFFGAGARLFEAHFPDGCPGSWRKWLEQHPDLTAAAEAEQAERYAALDRELRAAAGNAQGPDRTIGSVALDAASPAPQLPTGRAFTGRVATKPPDHAGRTAGPVSGPDNQARSRVTR